MEAQQRVLRNPGRLGITHPERLYSSPAAHLTIRSHMSP